jgi:hypothetical protein
MNAVQSLARQNERNGLPMLRATPLKMLQACAWVNEGNHNRAVRKMRRMRHTVCTLLDPAGAALATCYARGDSCYLLPWEC